MLWNPRFIFSYEERLQDHESKRFLTKEKTMWK